MGLTDDELLDFDRQRLEGYDAAETERALVEHGDVFRAQLVAARWIDGWRQRMAEDVASPTSLGPEDPYHAGRDEALREVAAHLRLGDLLPGGVLYEDEVTGRLGR